jgi:DNA repair ATPase RecN
MRHPKSKVVVFDQVHRMWKGCDWLPSDENSKDAMILVEHRALERRVIAMDGELRKALKEIKRLNKQMADLYSDAKEMGKSQDEDVNWLEEMKESLGRPSKKPRKTKHQPPVNTIESMVAAAWK